MMKIIKAMVSNKDYDVEKSSNDGIQSVVTRKIMAISILINFIIIIFIVIVSILSLFSHHRTVRGVVEHALCHWSRCPYLPGRCDDVGCVCRLGRPHYRHPALHGGVVSFPPHPSAPLVCKSPLGTGVAKGDTRG